MMCNTMWHPERSESPDFRIDVELAAEMVMRRSPFAVRSAGLAIVAALSACGSGNEGFQILETFETQGDSVFLEYAPSRLAFGPADIRVGIVTRRSTSVLYEGTISNDGGEITLDNIRPNTDNPGFLWLCLNGVEQKDVAVRIEYVTRLVMEEERHCSD